MILYCEHKMTEVTVAESNGCYRQLLFATMDKEKARQLVRQYGYRPETVVRVATTERHYVLEVDDTQVLEWVDGRMHGATLTQRDLHIILREHCPHLSHTRGDAQFLSKYKLLTEQCIDSFNYSTTNKEATWKLKTTE